MGNESSVQTVRVYSKKQAYAIAKEKEMSRRTSMCIAEDKGMNTKYWMTLRCDPKLKDSKGFPLMTPVHKDTDKETTYLRELKLISIFKPTYKQCCTGLSSVVRNSIVIDVDDDYEIAEKKLAHIQSVTDGKFPQPNFRVINTKTNHIQYMYILRDFVPYEEEKDKFVYQRVTRLMNAVIGGDLNFKFYQCKNPLSQNPTLRTIKNLPDSIDGFLPFSYFVSLADLLENLSENSLDDESYILLLQAKEMNQRKIDSMNKASEKKNKPNKNNISAKDCNKSDSKNIERITKNIDKVIKNDTYKDKIEQKNKYNSSRNVLAKDYARKFVWYCMLNNIEVNIISTVHYLMSKNEEICQKVGKRELLSMTEINSTAKCTYYWCLANFDREKARHGSFTDRQRQNSLTMRHEKAYQLAKECVRLRNSGCQISEISDRLLIHRNTVRNYIRTFDRLFKKHCQKREIDRTIDLRRKEYKERQRRLAMLNARLALSPSSELVYSKVFLPLNSKFSLNKIDRRSPQRGGSISPLNNNFLCRIRPSLVRNGTDPPKRE